MFVDLLECFSIRFVESDFLPELVRQMGSFCSFHIEVAYSLFFSDGSILRIGEGTRSTVAKTGQVVLVFAEVLRLGPIL